MNSQEALKSGLYLVATPIGNMRDITLRAIDVLAGADVILCEDTRVSGKLLKAYDIQTKLIAYHDHSSDALRAQIIGRLQDGEAIALISDAGMPLISDPGYKLVKLARDNDLYVTSVPGANAALAALQLSGLPSHKFTFMGFAPTKKMARRALFDECRDVPATLIFYEGASRILKMLDDIHDVLGDRPIAIARELTKLYEEIVNGSAEEVRAYFEGEGTVKGEFVVMISPGEGQSYDEDAVTALLVDALKTQKVKQASSDVSQKTGWKKSDVYSLALSLKNDQ